jgi:TolA-binding protein
MRSAKLVEIVDPKLEKKPDLTDTEKKAHLEQAIEKQEKLAESGLEMAKMFLQNGKQAIALRRLREIVKQFAGSAAADEAKDMLKKLKP